VHIQYELLVASQVIKCSFASLIDISRWRSICPSSCVADWSLEARFGSPSVQKEKNDSETRQRQRDVNSSRHFREAISSQRQSSSPWIIDDYAHSSCPRLLLSTIITQRFFASLFAFVSVLYSPVAVTDAVRRQLRWTSPSRVSYFSTISIILMCPHEYAPDWSNILVAARALRTTARGEFFALLVCVRGSCSKFQRHMKAGNTQELTKRQFVMGVVCSMIDGESPRCCWRWWP